MNTFIDWFGTQPQTDPDLSPRPKKKGNGCNPKALAKFLFAYRLVEAGSKIKEASIEATKRFGGSAESFDACYSASLKRYAAKGLLDD
ncbi:MAG: hypothetical protein R8K20_11315 [Gallionellaceae bacterium]